MSRTVECFLCDCGDYHPVGAVCDKPKARTERRGQGTHGHEHKHAAAASCGCGCGHGHADDRVHDEGDDPPERQPHSHEHAHEADGCDCAHAAAATIDPAIVGKASETRAVYRIVNMDCPMEEALIRKKLGGVPGIEHLEFNLMQRVLTVDHHLPSTKPIEEALGAIDMTPEPLGQNQGVVATFHVAEMDCPAEEGLIRAKLAGMPGVLELDFNLMQRALRVRHEPSALPAISEALAALDLGAKLADAATDAGEPIPPTKIPWRRLAVAGVLAAGSEIAELILEWRPESLDTLGGAAAFAWLPAVLAVAAILLGGLTTYKKGWLAVRNLNLNINALMSVAVTGAAIIGQYPEAAMVMVLFNIAEAIEAKALDRARNAIKDLLNLTPEKATVRRPDGSWEEMDIRQIAVGSTIRVRPGERVALDGVIVSGQSTINQAPITGESMPVEKTVGDGVFAGTINESGSFEFEATSAAADSTLARIIHAVEEAQGSRAPIQRFVDQFAKIYTPAVFLVAILVAAVPPLFLGGEWRSWIYTALVLLVIGCPCALVISTPVSVVSGMAAAARSGILIKGGIFLEQGRLLKWLALDKTGTLTRGKPSQTDFVGIGSLDEEAATALAASIAARSDHPVSRAVATSAAQRGTKTFDVTDFAALPGRGVGGTIDGVRWHLGNHRMIEELGRCAKSVEKRISELEKEGKSVVALVDDDGVEALFAVADTLKPGSAQAIRELKQLGVKTLMLTGDNVHTARVVAEQVGVDDFKGNLLPGDKLKEVARLSETGKVGMVGDGINDAPALAKADIGFAMAAAGTDTAIETADVALMDDDLRKIPRFIGLSRATYAILVQNITLALAVKALFFGLTLADKATMWMAVIADVGTSLVVVANGLRAMRK